MVEAESLIGGCPIGMGLHDLTLEAVPRLTRRDFGIGLKQYIKKRHPALVLDRVLLDSLYLKTYYCLQQLEALPKMCEIVESKDWNRRAVVIGKLLKKLNSFELGYRSCQK
jgi:hypothetical protein